MPFNLPNFNLFMDGWNAPATPAAGAPTVLGIRCQLYIASRGLVDIDPSFPDLWVPPIYIRVPTGPSPLTKGDIAEVIPGSADYYKLRWVQKIHLGFPNEYLVWLVEQCDADGTTPRT